MRLVRAGVGGGDEEQFTAFVRVHGPALVRFARLLTGDQGEAEDLVQVALLRLAGRWSTVRTPLAYTRQAVARLAIDRGRRRHLVPQPLAGAVPDAPSAEPDVAEAYAAQARLGHHP